MYVLYDTVIQYKILVDMVLELVNSLSPGFSLLKDMTDWVIGILSNKLETDKYK